MRSLLFILFAACLLCSCTQSKNKPWKWDLPAHFPRPIVPKNNPMTQAKVTLGRHLFYDKRLSSDGKLSCSSCHFQKNAFADGKTTPKGAGGVAIPRNSMSLSNTGFLWTYTWSNPVLKTLEQQAQVPLFVDFPPELNIGKNTKEVLRRFEVSNLYQKLFVEAFPTSAKAKRVSVANIIKALASFQRSMISAKSPYDRYLLGQKDALSSSAKRGLTLFNSSKLKCSQCHSGVLLTRASRGVGDKLRSDFFQNNGLYNLGGKGLYPAPNIGLNEFTKKAQDMGKFRVPSLRNIEVTGPYMHDGSIPTLEKVIEHYARGGRLITQGSFRGDGSKNPHKSRKVSGFSLSPKQKFDLIAFLKSLTDKTFLQDKRFSNPFLSSQN